MVPQDRVCQGLDVLYRNVQAAEHQRPRLGAEHQGVRSAQPRAPLDPFLDEIELRAAAGSRIVGEPDRVAGHFVGDEHLPHVLQDAQDVGAVEHA
jgi:hypothetical protein